MTKITEFQADDYGDEPVMYQDMDHFLLEREQRIIKSREQRKDLSMRSENERHRTQEYCSQRMSETSRYLRRIVECKNDMRSENPSQQDKRFGDIIDRIAFSYKPKLVVHDTRNSGIESAQKFEKEESKDSASISPSHSQNSLDKSSDDEDDEKQMMNKCSRSDEEDHKSDTGSSSCDEVVEKKTSFHDDDDNDGIYDKIDDDGDDGTITRNENEDVNMLREEVQTLKSENNSLRARNKSLEEELEKLRNRLHTKDKDDDGQSDTDT